MFILEPQATIRFARPHANASLAFKSLPVNNKSIALEYPIVVTNLLRNMFDFEMSDFLSIAMIAFSSTMRISHHKHKSKPIPYANPETAAIIGFLQ